jgi:hypothetical protein
MFEHSKTNNKNSNKKVTEKRLMEFSNPLSSKNNNSDIALSDYTQVKPRQQYDEDMSEIIEVVRILNNIAPIRMPKYNFNIKEINGEHYYRPDGTLLLIREWDNDVIRDYYPTGINEQEGIIKQILEHDKASGRLKVKIEPVFKDNNCVTANITIFDFKINNKYTLIQVDESGFVKNITEFSGKGKSFQTLFRNLNTFKPARYIEGRDNSEKGFEMIDCIFDSEGKIARIKKYNNQKEINIDYSENSKNITVKSKNNIE